MAGPWVRRGKLRDMLLPEGMSMLSAYKVGLEGAKNAIDVIEEVFLQEGFTRNAAAAAATNALMESGLNPSAMQKGGGGVGLFQLTGSEAAKGTTQQRLNPVFNATYMARNELAKGAFGYAFRKADAEGADVPTLTAIFARDIERCACCGYPRLLEGGKERTIKRKTLSKLCKGNPTLEREERVKIAATLFPANVNTKSNEMVAQVEDYYVRLGEDTGVDVPWGSLLIATGALLTVAGIEYRKGV